MREAEVRFLVEVEKDLSATLAKLFALVNRLTATASATRRARHALNEIIMNFLVADCLTEFANVAEAVSYCDLQLCAGDLELSFFPAVVTANVFESVRLGVLARYEVVSCAQCRLHNSAGRSEDMTRARGCP